MSDIMYPVSFGHLMNHILTEYATHNRVYNVERMHTTGTDQRLSLFGRNLENPLGPAAGPHTQLAQNLVAAYVGGSRFLELKTVQIMFGEELGIPRPCIYSKDEAYNVEWSSEYHCHAAADEYIKAWFAIKLISKEWGIGDPDGFIFIMSVGYNLAGIQSKDVDSYMESLRAARTKPVWKECEEWALANVHQFKHVTEDYIHNIDDNICQGITLSTMHGCPAGEIESICTYLMKEKHLNLYLKCNPTLLGYDRVRELLDQAEFGYIDFDAHQFEVDLSFKEAVPMIERLLTIAEEEGLVFGVKLTNTFPVSIHEKELPGEQMYMSGKSLLPLSIGVAQLLSETFGERLPMSYSGGADAKNIAALFRTGIWPITVCTTLLQGLGYNQLDNLAKLVEAEDYDTAKVVKPTEIKAFAEAMGTAPTYKKSAAAKKKREEQPGFPTAHDKNHECRVVCGTCVRVCPNRTNECITVDGKKLIIHIDESCNECGNCACHCVQPCFPYKDKLTYFIDEERLLASDNDGFYIQGKECGYRFQGATGRTAIDALPEVLKGVVEAFIKELPYYIYDTH